MDPLQALQAAYAEQPDSAEQADHLSKLREYLEENSNYIPVLCSSLIRGIPGAQDSLIRRWTLDLLHYGISRANLSIEKRTDLAMQALDVLSSVLSEPNPSAIKITIQCFAGVYPLLFRYLCMNRQHRAMWDALMVCKSRILELLWSPSSSTGVKLAALKFMQRVILVQTRGVSDPRLQRPNDPNLSLCPPDHPFIPVAQLEAEGQKLMEGAITIFYTLPNPDMMSAVVNSWAPLAKQRPSQTHIIISALASWSPGAINDFPASIVRGVEKAVRILLLHFSRTPQLNSTYAHQIGEALSVQAVRMEQAVVNERNRKAAAAAEANRKRSITALSDEASEAKRTRVENPSASVASALANFDFTSLPHTLITDLIIANLHALTEQSLAAAVEAYKQAKGLVPPAASTSRIRSESEAPVDAVGVKEEPVIDPLQMEMDEDEVEYDAEKLNAEIAQREATNELVDGVEAVDYDETFSLDDFRLPPPKDLNEEERLKVVLSSVDRIWSAKDELKSSEVLQLDRGTTPQDLSMLLLVRMITRVLPVDRNGEADEKGESSSTDIAPVSKEERVREVLFDYVLTDFPSRVRLATIWMNEEWYNDQIRTDSNPEWHHNYPIWISKIVTAYEPLIDSKDRAFSRFLLEIPQIPDEVLQILRDISVEPERMQVGFTTLREFVSQRIPLRNQALKLLLDLTTHPNKITRGAAIITVKRWVPDIQPMGEMIRTFALRLLRRLQKRGDNGGGKSKADKENEADGMEDGEMPQEEVVQTEFLPESIELPAQKAHVLQHVELVFALCVKCPEFLDEIFDAYVHMDVSVQAAVQDLITALIKSLGPNHPRLSNLIRNYPAGAESLTLRVITIFTENGRPTPQLVSLVKSLVTEREFDARFLIPIIAEMDKADIIRHLPRIVSMLNGGPENKQLVKSVFESIVTTPPQTFGSVTSNLPRVRQSELLTPAELMVQLHESEKEIGLKSAIEAIGICFSMTDVFRVEIFAVVMQQIVDEPVLPVLFLRTVIQAVTTYKSLVGYVSTTLLSRLITKKIWTNPPLWEGFIRCAKVIAPASFNALLQLPKDQLRELVDKQPGLKSGLREYVLKKAGNKARQAGYLDIFGDDQAQVLPPSQPQPQPPPQAQTPELPASS